MIPKPKIAFSEKALAEMNHGGHSYVLTSVKARWTWIFFGVITLFFGALLFWGFFGNMVDTVQGTGILLLKGGVRPAIAKGSGELTQLNVATGSPVTASQVIGQIYNAEMFFRVRKLESEYRQLILECKALAQGSQKLANLRVAKDNEKQNILEELTKKYHQSLARSKQLSEMYQRLKGKGAVSMVTYYQALDTMLNTESTLLSTRVRNMSNSTEMEMLSWEQKQNLIKLKSQLLQKEFELKLAKKIFRDSFWVLAGFEGKVLEILKHEGSFVRQGDTIALIASGISKGLYLAGFVPAGNGKKIKPGMSAYFAPSSVSADEYGYIQGVVREVSQAPVTAEGVQAELVNSSLTRMIAGKTAVVRVTVELIPDSATVSGLKWTSRNGAPVKISNGELGILTINTDYRPPVSFIIPYAHKLLFGSGPQQGESSNDAD